LILMFKILFNTHVFHYGFALAFPAFLILVRFLVHEVPAWLPSGRQAFSFAHAMAPALILTYILAHASISYNLYMIKKYPVGVGSDMLLDYNPDLSERGPVLNAALHYIGTEIGAKEAFPVLPGGSMINYLSRHPNPFPFLTFDPLEMHFTWNISKPARRAISPLSRGITSILGRSISERATRKTFTSGSGPTTRK